MFPATTITTAGDDLGADLRTESMFFCPRPRCSGALLSEGFASYFDWYLHHKAEKPRHTKVAYKQRVVGSWGRERTV